MKRAACFRFADPTRPIARTAPGQGLRSSSRRAGARALRPLLLAAACLLVLAAQPALSFPRGLTDWQALYGADSSSGNNAACQLCHALSNGGSPWNAYGWAVRDALDDVACDFNMDGVVANQEAFVCVELLNSDGDPGARNNASEIGLDTQPGWTAGANNTLFSRVGPTPGQVAPNDIGMLDPDVIEPPPPPPPPPPSDGTAGALHGGVVVVKAGQSIQAAINAAAPGTTILVEPGIYQEKADTTNTNALMISKDGIRLIGLSQPLATDKPTKPTKAKKSKKAKKGKKGSQAAKPAAAPEPTGPQRVVLRNAGGQRNGIVVVPSDRTNCMSCHSSMAPPFPLLPGADAAGGSSEPVLYDLEVSGITIEGFDNNGLFTERVDGFRIFDVESIGNRNYGIFPTLSKNGLISRSKATGSDDSGIWVETSENVQVTHNLVEDNVNGFEVSNSDDIYLANNEVRNNTVGMALFLLEDIFDERPGANRFTVTKNWIHDNNRLNTGSPGSLLAVAPPGTGILQLSVDAGRIVDNRIENHDFFGVVLADYCFVLDGTDFDCFSRPEPVSPAFVMEQISNDNRVSGNIMSNNGNNPPPGNPFSGYAADITFATIGSGNCVQDDVHVFSLIGVPTPCE